MSLCFLKWLMTPKEAAKKSNNPADTPMFSTVHIIANGESTAPRRTKKDLLLISFVFCYKTKVMTLRVIEKFSIQVKSPT